MKRTKTKRVLALIGVVLLVALYVSTLIFAMIGSEDAMLMFKASVIMTIVVPALLWGYSVIYRVMKSDEPVSLPDGDESEATVDEEEKKD